MNYPTWSDLSPADRQASAFYDFADALRALGYKVAPMATVHSQETNTRKHRKADAPRVCLSRYVGVTQRRHRWVAQWGKRGQTTCKVFSDAPEDELKAAWFRARALGLSEPEVRR